MQKTIKKISMCLSLIAVSTFAKHEVETAKIGYCLTKYNSTGVQAVATATGGAMGSYAGAYYGAKIGCISGPGGAILGGVIGCGVGAL